MAKLSIPAELFRAQANEAIKAYNDTDYESCDTICASLLEVPDLPLVWRAECNYLLGTSSENTAVVFAETALELYKQLSARSPESAQWKIRVEEAQAALTHARQVNEESEEISTGQSFILIVSSAG